MSIMKRVVGGSVIAAVALGVGAGASIAAPTTDATGSGAVNAAGLGLKAEMKDVVVNEVILSWNKTDAAIWGWKLEADKPVLGKNYDSTVEQLHWQTFSKRLVLLKDGETINFTLTNNYTGEKQVMSYTVPVKRRSFDAAVKVEGNRATLSWTTTGDAPEGWRIWADKGSVADYAIVKKVDGSTNSVVLNDLRYGETTEIVLHNVQTLRSQTLKVRVAPLAKMPKATRTVAVPSPTVVDKKGDWNDVFVAAKATDDTVSTMDLDVKPGFWVHKSFTRDPNAAFPGGKRVVITEGKIKN